MVPVPDLPATPQAECLEVATDAHALVQSAAARLEEMLDSVARDAQARSAELAAKQAARADEVRGLVGHLPALPLVGCGTCPPCLADVQHVACQ